MLLNEEYYDKFPNVLKNALKNGIVKFPDSIQDKYSELVVYRAVKYSKNKTAIDKKNLDQ